MESIIFFSNKGGTKPEKTHAKWLSGIKPRRGTNRNEALHKELNKIVSSSRYGLELAFALFCNIFFQHERIAARLEKRKDYNRIL